MSKYVLLLLLSGFIFTTHSYSQTKRGSVKGVLIDTLGKTPMSNATISVTPAGGDSSDAEFVVSDKKGAFHLGNLKPGSYKLLITYESYEAISKNFTVSDAN